MLLIADLYPICFGRLGAGDIARRLAHGSVYAFTYHLARRFVCQLPDQLLRIPGVTISQARRTGRSIALPVTCCLTHSRDQNITDQAYGAAHSGPTDCMRCVGVGIIPHHRCISCNRMTGIANSIHPCESNTFTVRHQRNPGDRYPIPITTLVKAKRPMPPNVDTTNALLNEPDRWNCP